MIVLTMVFFVFSAPFTSTMSDIIKVPTSPQFNWHSKWTHLDTNGILDKTTEEGLKHLIVSRFPSPSTGRITMDELYLTKHASDQSVFFVFMLPDFKVRLLMWIPEDKYNDSNTLFMLMK